MEKIKIARINFKEDSNSFLGTILIDFKGRVDKSELSLFCASLLAEIAKSHPNNVGDIPSEVKLTHLSYLSVLFLLFKDSNLNIKVFNIKKQHSSFTRLQISFSFLKVVDNFRRVLSILYSKISSVSDISREPLIFTSKDQFSSYSYLCVDSYSELRVFFDSIIPKLNEYNGEFLSYNNKYGRLTIKIDYKNIFFDLWSHFLSNRHHRNSQKNDYLKKKIPDRTKQTIVACILLSVSIIIVCGILLVNFNSNSIIVFNVLVAVLLTIDIILYEALLRIGIIRPNRRRVNNKRR